MCSEKSGTRRLIHGSVTAIAAVLLSVLVSPLAFAQYDLNSRRDYYVGDHPVSVLAVDFDGDGVNDLMSADELSDYVSLLKGFGDGTFRRTSTLVAGSKPTALAFVDVNHDGFPDVVAANFLTQNVTVNLGDGHGHFGAKIATAVSAGPFGIAVGDWNGDSHIDVATVNTSQDNISILRGTGTGTFNNLTQITVGDTPNAILAADFNADNILDLAVTNTNSQNVQIWRGNGSGGFTLNLTLTLAAGSNPSSSTAADLNGDLKPDLVVAARGADSVKVYIANGSGGFNAPISLSTGFGPRAIRVDDINKDGFPDLLVAQSYVSGTGELAVVTGNGSGTTWSAPTVVSTGPVPTVLTSADFNKDGNLDVVTGNLTGNSLSILETIGNGAFIIAGKVALGTGSFPTSVVVADFNKDGKPDIATTDEANDRVITARGNGGGTFLAPVNISTGNLSAPEALVALDTNNDTWPDLAVVTGTNTLSVLQNNGSGTLTASNGLSTTPCSSPVAISAGDINADGKTDIAFVCEISYHVCTKRGTGSGGASAFGPTVCTLVDADPQGVAIGQYNFDTLADIAFTSQTNNWVNIGFSDGFGGFGDIPSSFPTGLGPREMARGDLNNDGYQDLVVANSASGTVSALLGDGGGVFSFPSIESVAGESPNAVALADLNNDGKLDAAVVNANGNDVSFLLGDGFGNFTKAGDFGTRDLPLAVAAGDFNADGKPDLAVADNYTESVTILLNQSILGDPLASAIVIGHQSTYLRWGLVPGALYDVIRGNEANVTQTATTVNLGPVTCIANDIPDTDTANFPDPSTPPVGQAYFYLIRSVVGGVAGNYGVSSSGKFGFPSSGGCQ
ncbi:MAG TPA: VCBS repeat-containing protein [Candidatus Polarisedimenticolia bacterium]|nr:VCBS repeat-containing protein [Candidatus Polarisedimenticolia bacterium]